MALTLTVPAGNFHLAGNPIRVVVTGAVAPVGSTNYKVMLKVISTDSLLMGTPFIDAIAPVSGTATFDVSGYIDQPQVRTFNYPLSGGVYGYNNDTFDIQFVAGESYIDADGDLQETFGTNTATHFVVKGGVSDYRLGKYKDANSSFYADFVTGGKFLTRQPNNMVVSPTQPVKLWLLSAASVTGSLRIRANYDDGGYYIYASDHGLYADILHEVNCLPTHADAENMPMVVYDLEGNVSTRMTSYEISIHGKTETRTFKVDHAYYENNNYLFALNSLGGIDVIWLNGAVKFGFESDLQVAIKPRQDTDSARIPTRVVSSRKGVRKWTINSGYKSTAEMQALADVALSKQAWLLTDGELIPVIAKLASADLYDNLNDLHDVDLEIEEAHNLKFI